MSKDNLILFPKKSTSNIDMTHNEVKWTITGTLMLILAISIGINSTLLNPTIPQSSDAPAKRGRSLASVNPLFKISWEKKALEVLKDMDERDLASIGKQPSAFDSFAFGTLEGKYAIQLKQGQLSEVNFSGNGSSSPKAIRNAKSFIENHLAVFSTEARQISKVHSESNGQMQIERYQLLDRDGQDLGVVQLLLNENSALISMTVQ